MDPLLVHFGCGLGLEDFDSKRVHAGMGLRGGVGDCDGHDDGVLCGLGDRLLGLIGLGVVVCIEAHLGLHLGRGRTGYERRGVVVGFGFRAVDVEHGWRG